MTTIISLVWNCENRTNIRRLQVLKLQQTILGQLLLTSLSALAGIQVNVDLMYASVPSNKEDSPGDYPILINIHMYVQCLDKA